jgi:hypothetical protein
VYLARRPAAWTPTCSLTQWTFVLEMGGSDVSHRRSAVAAILGFLVVTAFAVPARAQQPETPQCQHWPANLETSPALIRYFMSLVPKSATLRRQCAAIADAPDVRVVLRYAPRPPASLRAHSTIERHQGRLVRVIIEIPVSGDFAELLAHELEHTVEAIEGLDVRSQANVGGSGVSQLVDGVYETARAQRVGRLAHEEINQKMSARGNPQR